MLEYFVLNITSMLKNAEYCDAWNIWKQEIHSNQSKAAKQNKPTNINQTIKPTKQNLQNQDNRTNVAQPNLTTKPIKPSLPS